MNQDKPVTEEEYEKSMKSWLEEYADKQRELPKLNRHQRRALRKLMKKEKHEQSKSGSESR